MGRKAKTNAMPVCEWCKKKYTRMTSRQKYCSKNCLKQVGLKKKRERVETAEQRETRRRKSREQYEKSISGLHRGSWGMSFDPWQDIMVENVTRGVDMSSFIPLETHAVTYAGF